jgi:hypothetical protein
MEARFSDGTSVAITETKQQDVTAVVKTPRPGTITGGAGRVTFSGGPNEYAVDVKVRTVVGTAGARLSVMAIGGKAQAVEALTASKIVKFQIGRWHAAYRLTAMHDAMTELQGCVDGL